MKNKDSKARMQMIFGILLFAFIFMAELYAMVNFPKMFIVLAVLAVADLICLYVAINGIISVYETKYARREEQYESIFKSEKASYLMLKKYFEEISVKLAYMEEASKIPTEEIVNAQKGIAKVIIKRSHENTEALMNSYEQLMDQFTTFQQGIDGLGTVAGAYKEEILSAYKDEKSPAPRDEEVHDHAQDKETVAKLQEIILAIKDMELRLNQTIMNSQKVVVSQPQVSVPVATPVEPQWAPQNHVEEIPAEPEISPEPEESMEPEPEISPDLEENPEPEILPDLEESMEPEPEISPEPEESMEPESEISPEPEESMEPDPEILPDIPEEESFEPEEEPPVMAADEIIPPDPEESIEEAEELVEPDPIPEDAIVEEANDGNLPEEELSPMPDLSDPNRAMSPDEIAALFANMGNDDNADKAGEPVEEMVEPEDIPEPIEEPEAVKEAPLQPEEPADPNKALSPDEIAALFASMGT